MITLALVAWYLSGLIGWAWFRYYLWVEHPYVRDDITICTVLGGLLAALFGPVQIVASAAVCGLKPFGIRCPVLIRANKK